MAVLDHININGSLYDFKDASAYQKPNGGIPSSDLTSAIQELLARANTALQPNDLNTLNADVSALKALVESDSDNVIDKFNEIVTFLNGISASSSLEGIISDISSQINAKYTKPVGGIPMNDLSSEVQQAIGSGGSSPTITMDDTPTSGSNNAVKSSGIYNALQGKQNTLTFDSTPTASSNNPVTSGGVKNALDLKANQSDTYNKTEVDGLLEDAAILADDDGQATTLTFDPQADTVWNKAQTLGSAQQAQARNNIGAVGSVTVNGTTYTPTNGNVDLGTISGGGGSSTGANVMVVTQAYYDSLSSYDSNTIYVISDALVTAPEVTIMTAAEYAASTKSSTTVYFVS